MSVRSLGILSLPLIMALHCSPAISAESDSLELTLEGTATPVCRLPEVMPSNAVNASMTGGTITVSELVDKTDASIKPWSIRMTFAGAMCNYNAFIHIESEMGGLRPTTELDQVVSGSGAFLDRVDYKVTGTWGGITINPFDTATGTHFVSLQSPGPNQGDLVIELKSDGSSVPLIQGQYEDRITVHIGAQL